MRRTAAFLTIALLVTIELQAQKVVVVPPPEIENGLGELHHPVSTSDQRAQAFFDQGLKYAYAFNHEEAIRSFRQASIFDPNLAIAHWGIALALGPNINLDIDPDRERAAYDEVQKAKQLESHASADEKDLIDALALRYSNDSKADLKKLASDYSAAMKRLVDKYPDDLDIAVLYAESVMDLNPWKLWSSDGTPASGTLDIASLLERVLRRDPNHIGANHFYIHVMEASPYPERAIPSAIRLEKLAPAAGHLVHMPGHVYMRTGDYNGAVEANQRALDADREYIRRNGNSGIYSMMYYNHNFQFLASAAMMAGRYEDAHAAAEEMVTNLEPMASEMPMIDPEMAYPTLVALRFRRWDVVINSTKPSAGPQSEALWHFARAVAFARKGDLRSANIEAAAFSKSKSAISPDSLVMLNKSSDVFAIASKMLDGELARAAGNRKDAISAYRDAVSLEDRLAYDEPPDWLLSSRESLGGALLLDGRFAEAEKVFRDELERNRRSGRALFGLAEALRREGRTKAAAEVDREFHEAWRMADSELTVDSL